MIRRIEAIEVYLAAALLAHGVPIRGYKAADQQLPRNAVQELVCRHLATDKDIDLSLWSLDMLDAVICVMAGVDFLNGRAQRPADEALVAKREGWIWAANSAA